MKSAHLKKIAERVVRLTPHFDDEARVWRMLVRTVPNIDTQVASNRANDLTRVLRDVPELVMTIRALRVERTELRRENQSLRRQLADAIVGEDGVEVEREPGVGDILVSLGYLD